MIPVGEKFIFKIIPSSVFRYQISEDRKKIILDFTKALPKETVWEADIDKKTNGNKLLSEITY